MLNENFLLDEYEQTGNDLDDFKALTEEMAEHTLFAKCDMSNVTVMNYYESNLIRYGDSDSDETISFHRITPKDLTVENMRIAPSIKTGTIKLSSVLKKGNFTSLVSEMKRTGVMFFTGNKCMFVSSKVITGRMHPFGLDGDFLQEHSFGRSLMLAERFAKCKPAERTLVIRQINGIKKVFSILGKNYSILPQVILMEIYEKLLIHGMGKVTCRAWNVTHFTSTIHVEFPDKAAEFKALYGLPDELVPGLLLQTSDTGDSSLRIQGTWRHGDSVSLHHEIVQKHRGAINVDEIIKDVDETIFSEYTKMPETLCNLMAEDITDPTWDLNTTSGKVKNRKLLSAIMRNASLQLNLTKAIGKKAECQLMEQLIGELDEGMAYTAYDMALHLMNAPSRIEGLHPLKMDNLASAIGRAPYIKFEVKKAPALTLTA